MPRVGAGDDARVVLLPSGRRGLVAGGTSLLEAARSVGVEIESLCGGRQTCGRCAVEVEEGAFPKHGLTSAADHLSPPEPRETDLLARRGVTGRRLSCAAGVHGDVVVTVPEESRAAKQVIAKDAGRRAITVDPAVRQVYVEVPAASLDDQRGDWERLREALGQQWRLTADRIDLPALRRLPRALRDDGWSATVTVRAGDPAAGSAVTVRAGDPAAGTVEVLDVRAGYDEGAYGLAVDVGSTSVAAHLCDLRSGALLATESGGNPQVSMGEDLMSRVSYAADRPDGGERLRQAIVEEVNTLARRSAAAAGVALDRVYEAVIVGNSVMHHLLLGVDPAELGAAPFAVATAEPVDVKARDLGVGLAPAAAVHLLPLEAGHVGADNVAVALAEELDRLEGVTLAVDVGTNAEILLAVDGRLFSASSPTGPAFEGAQISAGMRAAPGAVERVRVDRRTGAPRFKVVGEPAWSDRWPPGAPPRPAAGICGSGIIEAVAQLYLAGVLRPDGRFAADAAGPWMQWRGRTGAYALATAGQTVSGRPLLVTQEDVRAVQLAKAALYAGVRLLLARAGCDRVDRVLLAGAFGSSADPWHAMVLGLIPDCDPDSVRAVGNAAGDGARIALLDRRRRAEAARLARAVTYVETAVEPSFIDEFVAAMPLPHARDAFPHLAGVLPAPPADEPRRRRRAAAADPGGVVAATGGPRPGGPR